MRRVDFLLRSLEVAAELGAEGLNLATGRRAPDPDLGDADRFVVDGLGQVLERGLELGVPVTLEPEPGHHVETLAHFDRLAADLPELRLCLDVSHVSVAEPEGTAAEAIRARGDRLALVHLEDAPLGRHEHLPFGEGELPIGEIVAALVEARFEGLCAVELSRHSHAAHELTAASLAYLRAAEG
jgi:sugar phosphate isomerase/epimerase